MLLESLRGALLAQTVTTVLVLLLIQPSASLRQWYRALRLDAMVLDVLSLALGAYVGLRLAPAEDLVAQVGIAVLAGVVHDVSFGYFLHVTPRGASPVLDLFKAYAAEKRWRIVFDDALMIAGAVVASRVLVCYPDADAIAALLAYVNLMLVHSF